MEQKFSAEIISTGSELMLGRMIDTNSAWISSFLGGLGLPTVRHTSVGDDMERLVEAFKRGWAESDLVVVTGGLGPTEDDLTRPAAAEAFGLELEFHAELAEQTRELFRRRGYTMTDNNLRQDWLPRGSLLVPNPTGTAPGFALADEKRLMVFLPGVPSEMKIMAEQWLKPRLKERFHSLSGLRRTVILHVAGLGESAVDSRVGDLMIPHGNPEVGLLAGPYMVRVLVTATGRDEAEVEARTGPVLAELEKRLHGHIFGYDEGAISGAVAGLLKEKDLKLTILDALTQGRLNGQLAPVLEPDNFNGCQDMPWQPAISGALEILRLYAPDSPAPRTGDQPARRKGRRQSREIRLIVTAKKDHEAPTPPPGQLAIVVESAVQGEFIGNGRPLSRKFRLGGERDLALSRAAALSIFHLWQTLKGFSDEDSQDLKCGQATISNP